jgi:hypothetical protein
LWQLGVGVILAATALFGGPDTVDTRVTTFKSGDEFNDELRGGSGVIAHAKPGRRYLGVAATVRNDGTEPGTTQKRTRSAGISRTRSSPG